jgi:glucose/arabinose dehydrogenase
LRPPQAPASAAAVPRFRRMLLPLLAAFLLAWGTWASAAAYRLETVAEGLDHPWCLAFLPDGSMLVTERPGRLRRLAADGTLGDPIAGVPPVYARSQGGLFDVLPDPAFERNGVLYLSFAHGTATANGTRVIRGVLDGDTLREVQVLLTVAPLKDTAAHFGGRLLFLPDGTLLLTTGDGFDYREAAQDPFSQLGKVLRLHQDGSVPGDNPFADGVDGDPYVWTLGHRNGQGLALEPDTQRVWLHEHGPRGGDEFNRLLPGRNYGWPLITHGVDYSGAYVTPYTALPGLLQPARHWTPSIAPSGLAFYDGPDFPEWRGDAFLGTLVDRDVVRLILADGIVVGHERLFGELGERIRDVRTGPEGDLWLLTDSDRGAVVRVRPVLEPDAARSSPRLPEITP